jgi:serine/threonine protein kinase
MGKAEKHLAYSPLAVRRFDAATKTRDPAITIEDRVHVRSAFDIEDYLLNNPCLAPELRPDYDKFNVHGQVVAKHRLVRVIGSGGMGTVYEGEHLQLSERRALKFCRVWGDEPSMIERRALNEAKIGAMLRHPAICVVHDFELAPDGCSPVIVMELLKGRTLTRAWKAAGFELPWPELFLAMSSVCDALALAHSRGVVHRDIKLENIFLTPSGPKVVDFGISMLATARATRTGTHLGTPHYMAPEQIENPKTVDGRADLYSCGVVLYQGITGRVLFPDLNLVEALDATRKRQPIPIRELVPALPRHVAAIVDRCVEKDPAQRFQSAEELKAALASSLRTVKRVQQLGPGEPSEQKDVPRIVSAQTVRAKPALELLNEAIRRRRVRIVLGVLAVAASVVLALLVAWLGIGP